MTTMLTLRLLGSRSTACACALGIAVSTLLLLQPPGALAQEPELPSLRARAKEQPGDAAAQLALGRALIRAGRLTEAETQMANYVRVSHGSLEALFEAARVPLAAGDSKRARAACQALVRKGADHVLTHVCMARAFLIWRRSSRALEHVQAALNAAPADPEALLALADLRRIQGDLDGARHAYEQLLAQSSSNAPAQLGLGLTLSLQQNERGSVEALRAALRADPRDPAILFELGQRVPGAEGVRLLQAAIAGRPGWPAAELALASAELREGDAAAAARRLQALLARERDNASARAQYGLALLALERPKEAEVELRKAVELRPNDYDTSFALARLYERTGRNEDAFAQYRYTADLKRENATPLIAAAELGLSLKRPLLASALLDRALERAPKSAHALALYAQSLAARDQPAAARDYYQRALQGEGPLDREAVRRSLAELK